MAFHNGTLDLGVLSRCPLRDALFAETLHYYSASYGLDFDYYYYDSDLFYGDNSLWLFSQSLIVDSRISLYFDI